MKSQKEITAKIIEQMETAGPNWLNPMVNGAPAGMPRNAITGHRYQGINVLLLGMTGGYWATYKQWQSKECQVRKGEKGTHIVFFKKIKIKDKDTNEDKMIPMLKTFCVFGANQVEGEFADKLNGMKDKRDETDVIADVEAWVQATGAVINQSNQARAFYSPAYDEIHVPNREVFVATETSSATECYYSTLLHELTHWTGHKSRLDRFSKSSRFGDTAYAREELVAELGAAFQCAMLGVSITPREDHAKYLNNWISVLKNDSRAILTAAAAAEKAVQFIEDLQGQSQEEAA